MSDLGTKLHHLYVLSVVAAVIGLAAVVLAWLALDASPSAQAVVAVFWSLIAVVAAYGALAFFRAARTWGRLAGDREHRSPTPRIVIGRLGRHATPFPRPCVLALTPDRLMAYRATLGGSEPRLSLERTGVEVLRTGSTKLRISGPAGETVELGGVPGRHVDMLLDWAGPAAPRSAQG